jgi:hypothetical protein
MSTAHRNVPDAAHAENAATVVPTMERYLDAAVRHFEAAADALGAPRPASGELTKMVHDVVAFTKQLFPSTLVIETNVDPEIRDDVCLVFQVLAEGSVDEVVALDEQWHRRVLSLAPTWPGLFCLSIDAR